MIKARADGADGTPTVFLGLSGENVARLTAGEPMVVDLTELGLPPTTVVLVYGKTERHIASQLEHAGLLPPGFASDMAEARPRREP